MHYNIFRTAYVCLLNHPDQEMFTSDTVPDFFPKLRLQAEIRFRSLKTKSLLVQWNG